MSVRKVPGQPLFAIYTNGKRGDVFPTRRAAKKALVGGALKASQVKGLVEASYGKKGSHPTIDGLTEDTQLSTKKAKVYTDAAGKPIIVHRGTNPTAQDWFNNGLYALGLEKYSKRYKVAERKQDQVIKKYGEAPITVGHSQSAIYTRALNKKGKAAEIINVNPASKGERRGKNETVVKSSRDPVSLLQKTRHNDVVIPAKSWNPLTEHSGNVLDRVDPNRMIGKGKRTH